MFILFRSVNNKAKLLGEECKFFSKYWLLLVGYSYEFAFFNLHAFLKTNVSFDSSVIIGTCLEEQCNFLSDSRLPENGSSWKPLLPPRTLCLKVVYTYICSRNNWGKFDCIHLPGSVSALIGEIFMKISIFEVTNIHNTQKRVRCDRSKIIVM